MKIDLAKLTIKSAREHLDKGDFSSVDLTKAYLDEISSKNKDVNAYLEVFDDATEQAKAADKIIGGKKAGLLTGIPGAIKDNILIKGRVASASSKILEKYKAPYDSTVISKLREAGSVFLGRTNMDEFAMGGSTENSAFGVTKNPHDLSRVAGGSSGGSAAAVAMNGALFSLGSDTGGSIREPASFCGLVGLKPTYGSVSRYGLMAMGSSLDVIGPFAKTVSDAEIIFNAIKGKDKKDGTSHNNEADLFGSGSAGLAGAKKIIGVPRKFLNYGIDSTTLQAFEQSLEVLKGNGYKVVDVDLPNIEKSLAVYYIVMPAEVSSNMSRYDGVKYGLHVSGKTGIDDYFETRRAGLGKEVIRRVLLGTYVLSSGYYDAYYNRAIAVRKLITDDFLKVFADVDLIATPTAPGSAFKIGEKAKDPVAMYLEDIFTVPANLTGMPAISLPTPPAKSGDLPIGFQLTASHGREDLLFAAGKDLLGE